MQPQNIGTPSSSGPAPYNLTPLKPNDASRNTNALGPSASATPITKKKSPGGKPVALGEIGKSGTYIFEGIITQEDYVADLTRWELIKKIEIMRRSDATIAALLRMINWQMMATDWYVEPASEEQQDIEAADLVRQELFKRNIKWTHFMREALLMLPFGYQVFEKVWEYAEFQPEPVMPDVPKPKPEPPKPPQYDANGMLIPQPKPEPPEDPEPIEQPKRPIIGLQKLAGRKQRSIYKWETVDHEAGITQYVPGNVFSIPMQKLLIFTFDKEGDNFEGIPLLRQVYKNWDLKDKIEMIDAMAHERQGLGVLEVIVPPDLPQTEKDALLDAAEEIRANERGSIAHQEGTITEWMDMKGKTTTDRLTSIEYHNGQIFMSILGQFMMVGQRGGSKGASGARATSEDQSKFFEMGLEALAKDFASVINSDLIPELCDYNFSDLKAYPTLEHAKIGDENLQVISTALGNLLQHNGITMDADTEQWIRTLLHAPDLNEHVREDYDNRMKNIGQDDMPDPVGTQMPMMPCVPPQPNMSGGKQPFNGDASKDNQQNQNQKSNADKNSHVTATERVYQAIDALRLAKTAAIEAAEAEYDRTRAA